MTMRTVELGRMSWEEVAEVRRANPVVLLPVGTVEQHGPHLPVAADDMVAQFFALRVAEATGSVVAPALNYGCSDVFRAFPGTLAIRPETFQAVLEEVCEAIIATGFTRLVIVDNHGGNEPYVETVARRLRGRHGRRLLIGGLYPWSIGYALMRDVIPNAAAAYGHGGEPETSAMLAMFPEDVQLQRARSGAYRSAHGFVVRGYGKVAVPGFAAGEASLYLDADEVAPDGVTGDPLAADAAYGRQWVERVVAFGVAFVREFQRATAGSGSA
jgi:creatinine amidohydrolase